MSAEQSKKQKKGPAAAGSSSSSGSNTSSTDRVLTAKDFEMLKMFHSSLQKFVSTISDIWPECDGTKRYKISLEAIDGNETMIAKLVDRWHKQMMIECWEDKKKEKRTLYDAVDQDHITPFEQLDIKVLNKLMFKEKLAEIRDNPNEQEVDQELHNVMKHIKRINNFSRMIKSIRSDVREVMQQHSADLMHSIKRGDKVDMRPIKIGEEIMKKYSNDPKKQERALQEVVDNVHHLAPAIDNMHKDIPQNSYNVPNMSDIVNNSKQKGKKK